MKNLKEKQLETVKSEYVTVKVEFFYAKTDQPDKFIDKLEQICKEYCRDDFFFKYSVEN